MLLLLLGCAKPTEATRPPVVRPRVPSLQAPIYVHVNSPPPDAFVAKVWGGKLDEALSGAAAALGMKLNEGKALDPADLRWRAVLAGYPWPIREARTQRVGEDEVPQDLLAAAQAHPGEDLGLVRTRGNEGDQWVLLVGGRRGDLPAFPREPDVGQTLAFPGATVTAVTPTGEARTSRESLKVDAPGEWLVTLADAQGPLTAFPLYVGRPTPQGPPFAGAASAEDAGDYDEELLLRLDTLDAWYHRDAAERDPALDAVARARLRTFAAGQPLPDAQKQLAAAGFFDGTAGACRAATVADCLDAMWWSADGHAALGTPWKTLGFAVAPVQGGVVAVVAAADHNLAPLP